VLYLNVYFVCTYIHYKWAVSKVMKDRLMAVEVWFSQRMLKISRTKNKGNEEVFKEARVHRTPMKRIPQQ